MAGRMYLQHGGGWRRWAEEKRWEEQAKGEAGGLWAHLETSTHKRVRFGGFCCIKASQESLRVLVSVHDLSLLAEVRKIPLFGSFCRWRTPVLRSISMRRGFSSRRAWRRERRGRLGRLGGGGSKMVRGPKASTCNVDE